MSATDELRRLLDERGVKWWPDMYYKDANTCWRTGGLEWRASEHDGELQVGCTSMGHLTPVQAIETAMRHGTCAECVYAHISADGRHCKACDAFDRYFDGEWEPYFPSDFHCAHFEWGGDGDRV